MELPQRNFMDILSKTFDGARNLTDTSGIDNTMDDLTEEERIQHLEESMNGLQFGPHRLQKPSPRKFYMPNSYRVAFPNNQKH